MARDPSFVLMTLLMSADLKDQFEKAKQYQSEKEEQLTDALEKARQEAEIAVKLQRERDEIKSKISISLRCRTKGHFRFFSRRVSFFYFHEIAYPDPGNPGSRISSDL